LLRGPAEPDLAINLRNAARCCAVRQSRTLRSRSRGREIRGGCGIRRTVTAASAVLPILGS